MFEHCNCTTQRCPLFSFWTLLAAGHQTTASSTINDNTVDDGLKAILSKSNKPDSTRYMVRNKRKKIREQFQAVTNVLLEYPEMMALDEFAIMRINDGSSQSTK